MVRFKSAVRDFLIQLKEFSASNNEELYLEEKEAEQQRKADDEREKAANIPGMLKPSQIEDKDEELWERIQSLLYFAHNFRYPRFELHVFAT